MRPIRSLLVPVVLSLLIAGCAGAMRGLPRPSAEVTDVTVRDLNPESVVLAWDVRVTNPYTVSLPITGADYTLETKGRRFLRGSLDAGTSVPAGESTTVPLTVEVPFGALKEAVQSLEPGSVVPYTGTLALTVEAPILGPIVVESRTGGEFPIPAAPEVRPGSLRWEELSMQSARARLELLVSNPNDFSIELRSLSYRLYLDGRAVTDLRLERPLSLEPGGSNRLTLTFSFSPLQFGTTFLNTLQSERASYRLEGSLSAGTRFGELDLPVEREGSIAFHSGP